ncbi:MAG: ring-cleaving dioxygenase [Gemmatimonadaceae bacterium]|nr:ring-cleaving dioxygenase [Gemmatimonadaceae bacterium]
MKEILGLHHVTAIAGDARENLEFYTHVLGMRLVKRSVNQDSPGTYHLFYADAVAHPGTDLTFFPWPEMAPAKAGIGLTMEVSLAIPAGALEFWIERLESRGVKIAEIEERRGERCLPFADPHGLPLVLIETTDEREFVAWDKSPIAANQQVMGLHSVRLWERSLEETSSFLTRVLGFEKLGTEGDWHRFGVRGGGSGKFLEIRELPDSARGAWGTGGVHHIAWCVADLDAELAVRERIAAARRRPTDVIDRFWFKSVYFLEPGGALFEIATDGPGFTVDEKLESLGERLVLPPWLEPSRAVIEAALPELPRSSD